MDMCINSVCDLWGHSLLWGRQVGRCWGCQATVEGQCITQGHWLEGLCITQGQWLEGLPMMPSCIWYLLLRQPYNTVAANNQPENTTQPKYKHSFSGPIDIEGLIY